MAPRVGATWATAAGAAMRERVAVELLARPDGISGKALAEALGMPPSTLAWHLKNTPEAVLARTKALPAQRWFHKAHQDKAAAYLAAMDGRQKRDVRISPDNEARMVEAIHAAGAAGIATRALAAAIGLAVQTVQSFGRTVALRNGLQYVPPQGSLEALYCPPGVDVAPERGRAAQRARLSAQYAERLAAKVAAGLRPPKKVKPPKQPRVVKLAPAKPKKAATVAPQGPAIIPAGVRVTVCPSGTDNRFRVERPNPVFSGLRPGQYPVSTGSVVERVYAAR